MKEWRHPFGHPAEVAYVLLDPDVDTERRTLLLSRLQAVLPRMNWRSHLFVIGNGKANDMSTYLKVLEIATDFLEQNGFATLHVHVLVDMRGRNGERWLMWERLTSPARPFQVRARELMSEARLHIAPIIAPSHEVTVPEALKAAEFFNSRLALPSFYLPGCLLSELQSQTKGDEVRFFVDPEAGGLMKQLWMGHVLETALDRVDEESESLLLPCRAHLVIDERSGKTFSCFKQWDTNGDGVQLGPNADGDLTLPTIPTDQHCAACTGLAALSMRLNLTANKREKEGREVYFRLALALAAKEQYSDAAELAHHAYELSDSEQDRAAALIHESLCLRDARLFEKAEAVLELAGKYTRDRGLIAYYRGKVQFEWRDYIEALDRFEEALQSGSAQVPLEDMCFEMALCHINIEEYPEARPYLDRSLKNGEKKAPVSFYHGVCDFAEAKIQTALDHFTEALSLNPAEEDLGRVLFYIGACHKQMERFDEAIDVLEKAVAADPNDLANHNLLGFCYYKLKRHQDAVACFRRAVEIDPRSGIDWANLGSNLRDLGRIDEAVEMYRKALSLDPNIAFARDNMAKLTGER